MNNEQITRQEAIKKMGKFAAFAALGTMIILNPAQAQQQSPGGNGHHQGGGNSGGGNGNGFRSRRQRKSMFK